MLNLLALALLLPSQESPRLNMIRDAEDEAQQHLAAGRFDEAEIQALHAIALAKDTQYVTSTKAIQIAGEVYLERGENKRAFEWLQQQYRPRKDLFHTLLLGIAGLRAGNGFWKTQWVGYAQTDQLETIVGNVKNLPGRDTPEHVEASLLVLLADEEERPLNLAMADIKKALELAPDNAAALYVNSGLLLKQNKKTEARQALKDLLPKTSGKLHELIEARLKIAE